MSNIVTSTDAFAQKTFNWDETVAETKALVKEDAELTSTIDEAMVRRFEVRVRIGLNLITLQDEHAKKGYGDFTTTILPHLGTNERFAYRCIRVARLYQNSFLTRVSETNDFDVPPLPMNTWNKLASPSISPVVIEQVLSGEIAATPQAIKEANERAKQAEESTKDLQKTFDLFKQQTEQKLVQEVKSKQQELTLKEQEIDLLKRQKQLRDEEYKKLEQEKEQIAQSKVQTLLEDTPETKAKIEELEKQRLDLETKQKTLLEEKKNQETLLKQKTDQLKDQLKKKTESNKKLTEALQKHQLADKMETHKQQIRYKWYQTCDCIHLGIKQGVPHLVTSLDAQQCFESDDWARLAELEATLQEVLEKIAKLREIPTTGTNSFVDSSLDYVEE